MIYQPVFTISEECLLIEPTRAALEQWLHYTQKSLELAEDGYTREVVRERQRVFWRPDDSNQSVIATWPGFWKLLLDKCHERGWQPILRDARPLFPEPKYHLMHGFRFGQYDLLHAGLAQGCSGLIGAPTRYGKTTLIINTIRGFPGMKTLVVIPGKDLGKELYETIKRALPDRDVTLLGFGSRKRYQGDDVTVTSMSSLHLCDHIGTPLVLIDEVHALPTDAKLNEFSKFKYARKIGYGATTSGRFDGRDMLIVGAIGPSLAAKSYVEARTEGAVAPIVVLMLKTSYDVNPWLGRHKAYAAAIHKNKHVAKFIKWMLSQVIPHEWQTLGFVASEESANFFMDYLKDPQIELAMDKVLTPKARTSLKNRMSSGELKTALASIIWAQGVTFSDLRVVMNLVGGGANTSAVQKPGRVAEIRPGKRCGVVVDILPSYTGARITKKRDWEAPEREGLSRKKMYEATGYDVRVFEDPNELGRAFDELCL